MSNDQGIEVVETSPRDEEYEPIIFDYEDEVKKNKEKEKEKSEISERGKEGEKSSREGKGTDRSQNVEEVKKEVEIGDDEKH